MSNESTQEEHVTSPTDLWTLSEWEMASKAWDNKVEGDFYVKVLLDQVKEFQDLWYPKVPEEEVEDWTHQHVRFMIQAGLDKHLSRHHKDILEEAWHLLSIMHSTIMDEKKESWPRVLNWLEENKRFSRRLKQESTQNGK